MDELLTLAREAGLERARLTPPVHGLPPGIAAWLDAAALLRLVRPAKQVVANARAMATVMQKRGDRIVSGGTDDHLFLVDLIDKKITGKDAEAAPFGEAWITVNKNAVPKDPQSPFITSGIRIGTPACTTRGFKEPEVEALAGWICDILDKLGDASVRTAVRKKVEDVCRRFPVYEQ